MSILGRVQPADSFLKGNMNGLIFSFITFLALASGKSFIPVVYHGTFGVNPYVNPYTASYVFQTPQVPTPTFKSSAVVNVPDVPVAPVTTYHSTGFPVAPALNSYHAQSKDGSYSFGYFGGPSSRSESRDAFGNVYGAFNYVDPEGKIQSQQYVADANGFRVAATNLPLAPAVADVHGPNPVEDTPEVKAAKQEFDQTFQKAKQGFRVKRDAEADFVSATAYKAPASTAPLNHVVSHFPVPTTYSVAPHFVPNVHPFFRNFFSVSPKTEVVPTVYNVPTVHGAVPKVKSVAPTVYYTVPSTHAVAPKVEGAVPTVYTVPNTFPITYSAPYPLTYGSPIHPVFNFGKDSTVTKITHHPDAVSYRVDS